MNDLENKLLQFGLSKLEVQIYIRLLSKGASTVLELSKQTKINRTTVHVNVEKLIDKGLATHLKKGARRVIIAEPPEKLKTLIEEEKLKITQKEDSLSEVIKSVHDTILNVKENTFSEVRYYEGHDTINRLYDLILESKEVRTYVNPSVTTNVFPGNIEKFKQALIKGVEIWDLMAQFEFFDEFNNHYKQFPNYHFKRFPKDVLLNAMDYLIYGDSIAIVYAVEKPTAVVIKNKILALNARALFDFMWSCV